METSLSNETLAKMNTSIEIIAMNKYLILGEYINTKINYKNFI